MYRGEDEVNGKFYIDEEIYNDRVRMIAEPKVEWIMDVCKRENISLGSWLDIGSGGGEILFSLKEKGISAIGIESDRIEYRFSLEKGLDVRNLRVDFKNREVEKLIQGADAISFFNVLEHIPEPQKFIGYIYDNMKTGGLMVFEVPRHPSLASFANITGRDFVYRHIASPEHLTVFSEAGIERLLSGRFQILGKWCFGQGYVDIINNAMLWSKERENGLYEKVLDISNDVQKTVDEHGLADSIMVITRKSYNLLSAGEFL